MTALELISDYDPRRPAWHIDAACRDHDPDLFFPERGGSALPAKIICSSCPVRDDCLTDHIDELVGVWGGTSGRERRDIRAGRITTANIKLVDRVDTARHLFRIGTSVADIASQLGVTRRSVNRYLEEPK